MTTWIFTNLLNRFWGIARIRGKCLPIWFFGMQGFRSITRRRARPQNTKNGHIVVGYSKDAFFSAWVGTAKRGAPKSLKEQAIDKKEQAIDKPEGIGSDIFPL